MHRGRCENSTYVVFPRFGRTGPSADVAPRFCTTPSKCGLYGNKCIFILQEVFHHTVLSFASCRSLLVLYSSMLCTHTDSSLVSILSSRSPLSECLVWHRPTDRCSAPPERFRSKQETAREHELAADTLRSDLQIGERRSKEVTTQLACTHSLCSSLSLSLSPRR